MLADNLLGLTRMLDLACLKLFLYSCPVLRPPSGCIFDRVSEETVSKTMLALIPGVSLVGFELLPNVVARLDCKEVCAVDIVLRHLSIFEDEGEAHLDNPWVDTGSFLMTWIRQQVKPSLPVSKAACLCVVD